MSTALQIFRPHPPTHTNLLAPWGYAARPRPAPRERRRLLARTPRAARAGRPPPPPPPPTATTHTRASRAWTALLHAPLHPPTHPPTHHHARTLPAPALDRSATLVKLGLEYSLAGMICGFIGQGVANTLMLARRHYAGGAGEGDVPVPPLVRTSLVWGMFMGLSSNIRYQIVFGLERMVDMVSGMWGGGQGRGRGRAGAGVRGCVREGVCARGRA